MHYVGCWRHYPIHSPSARSEGGGVSFGTWPLILPFSSVKAHSCYPSLLMTNVYKVKSDFIDYSSNLNGQKLAFCTSGVSSRRPPWWKARRDLPHQIVSELLATEMIYSFTSQSAGHCFYRSIKQNVQILKLEMRKAQVIVQESAENRGQISVTTLAVRRHFLF